MTAMITAAPAMLVALTEIAYQLAQPNGNSTNQYSLSVARLAILRAERGWAIGQEERIP